MPKTLDTRGGSPPRRRRSAEVARKEILDAAQRRLSEAGPDAIRLQEIAADVGIAHPTILHHFGSREGLLRALDTRAIRALTEDIEAMIRSPAAPGSGVDLVERLAQTMDQQGLARLIAWWALRGGGAEAPGDLDPAALVQDVSDLIAERLRETEGSAPNDSEFVSFGVRLAVSAMLGDALIGDIMSPATGEQRAREKSRFRQWLMEILLAGRRARQNAEPDP
jgi:AcrR family transcriptional regulator